MIHKKLAVIVAAIASVIGAGCATTSPAKFQLGKVTRMYMPHGTSKSCDGPYNHFEGETTGQYIKTTKNDEKYEMSEHNAAIKIEEKDDADGFKQPTLVFYENGFVKEAIPFSNIEKARGAERKNETGETKKYVIFTYNMPVPGNLSYSRQSYFEVGIKNNLEGVTEFLETCSRNYRRAKSVKKHNEPILKCNPEPEDPKKPKKIKYATLTPEEQKTICNGGRLDSKKYKYIGSISFEDCKISPEAESAKLIAEKISRQGSLENRIVLFCGNATATSGNRCSDSVFDYGDMDLCVDRALMSAYEVNSFLKDPKPTSVIYPNRILLDKRTVEVYLIK